MPIRCLYYVEYDSSGWGWQSLTIADPDWQDIVAAIRRLDRFRHPWIWLFIGDNAEDPTIDCLTIMGGDSAYWVGLSAGKHDQLRLFDANKSSNEIELWTSDQGFSDYEFHTTSDVDLILRVAKHFADTGEPLPEASWEK